MTADSASQPACVVLLSGGLDSATALAVAKSEGRRCYALSFNYGQRSLYELEAAKRIAQTNGVVEHKILSIDLSAIGGSALTDHSLDVPDHSVEGVPLTYVPARNTILLSFALGWAEVLQAKEIFIGVNAVDFSGYPDCRPEYIAAFETMAQLATKSATQDHISLRIRAPLIDLSKAEIIKMGTRLGVDYSQTLSCYQLDEQGASCGACDSCRLRKEGFAAAGVPDPTRYS